jgi:hypothetical protein
MSITISTKDAYRRVSLRGRYGSIFLQYAFIWDEPSSNNGAELVSVTYRTQSGVIMIAQTQDPLSKAS